MYQRFAHVTGSLLLAVLFAGCGGKYDLHSVCGTVTLQDGTPLDNVQVTFKSSDPPLTATATTDELGRYCLGTLEEGDGAPAGDYRVSVVDLATSADTDHPKPSRIARRYGVSGQSGLQVVVPSDDGNYDLQLERPERR